MTGEFGETASQSVTVVYSYSDIDVGLTAAPEHVRKLVKKFGRRMVKQISDTIEWDPAEEET